MHNRFGLTRKQMGLLLGAVIFNFLVYMGARLLTSNCKHYVLTTPLDNQIPFLSWTVLIYWGCCLFWVINYYLGTKYDKGKGYRFIAAHYIGEAFCFLIFILFPTVMTRSEISVHTFWDAIVNLTYRLDEPNNLFPSIHCFVSWLCWIGVRKNHHIPQWYQWISLAIAVAVCISTLTVKQHVLADVPSAILLAEISDWIASKLEEKQKIK